MTVVETRVSVWEALAGRAPGVPTGPADPGLWHAVIERLNPARARPVLRQGIEDAHLVSARAVPYVMLTPAATLSATPAGIGIRASADMATFSRAPPHWCSTRHCPSGRWMRSR